MHVNQDKLNPRALRAVFLGYLMGTKDYKTWLIDDFRCIISRDMVFNESVFYKDLFNVSLQSRQVHIKMENFGLNDNSGLNLVVSLVWTQIQFVLKSTKISVRTNNHHKVNPL